MARRSGHRSTKVLWIFCEGETEMKYFQKLRYEESVGRLKILKTGHQDPEGVVNDAIDFIKKSRDYVAGDTVVCVFDRDASSDGQMDRAGRRAEQHDILPMFSNPSFEYWILCHFGYYPGRYDRRGALAKVREEMPGYTKGDPELYLRIRPKQNDASRNSRRIYDNHVEASRTLLHDESNPLTLIFKLLQMVGRFS